jgi:hypothetical protein
LLPGAANMRWANSFCTMRTARPITRPPAAASVTAKRSGDVI